MEFRHGTRFPARDEEAVGALDMGQQRAVVPSKLEYMVYTRRRH